MKQVTWDEQNSNLPIGLYTNPDGYVFYVALGGKLYNVRNKRGQLVYIHYPEWVINLIEKAVREDVDYIDTFHVKEQPR